MPSDPEDEDWENSPYLDDPTPPSEIPKMPCLPATYRQPHRDGAFKPNHAHMKALVARSVPPSEVRRNVQAQAAMKLEWERLRQMGTWDESSVREWSKVRADARTGQFDAHVGMIFGICVEKNWELPLTDPKRKYKGRADFPREPGQGPRPQCGGFRGDVQLSRYPGGGLCRRLVWVGAGSSRPTV